MIETFVSFLLTITFLLVLCLRIFQYFWNRRDLYRFSKNVPGPKGLPLVGVLFDFGGGPDEIHANMVKHLNFGPDLIKGWLGPFLFFGIHKPEHLEIVLNSPKALSKMYFYEFARPLVGYGLFSAPVPIWKKHRKIIMPAFNQKILDGFVEIFSRHSEELCRQFESFPENRELDLFRAISKCTLGILCETAMGLNCKTQTLDTDFGKWVDKYMETMFVRMFKIWYHFDFIFKWTSLYKQQTAVVRNIHQVTERVIREKHSLNNIKENCFKRKIFLDLLMENSSTAKKLTEEELRDEVNTFMIAGSDTTAVTNSFILLMLALHPEVQEKIYEETVQTSGFEPVESQDLPYFKYTERVIKETMRLFPIGPFIVRNLYDDIPLQDGVILPKGSAAVLCILSVHRNPKIWPDPLIFNPDRFLPEEVAKRHPYSYLPFSGGPRNCVGLKYAMMTMKVTIATLIRKFRFFTSYKSVEEIELKSHLTLRPKNGFKIFMQKRT